MKYSDCFIKENSSILDAIKAIDEGHTGIALVVDGNKKLIGVVTDTDIRKQILKGIDLELPVKNIVNRKPVVATTDMSKEEILKLAKDTLKLQIPVLDKNGIVQRIEFMSHLIASGFYDNWVILMAGGLGTRLSPLTDECPKPMVKVGGKPVLETILESFIEQGFRKFYLSVNHLKEQITEYFGDGAKWGIELNYLVENEKMGTAGALSLLPGKSERPFLVMNGDVLTKVNYKHLIDFHTDNKAVATMCVREYSFQIPYGVVKIDNNCIKEIDEKPVQNLFVNAGIYVLEQQVLKLIPENVKYDMTTLFEKIIENEMQTAVFPIREYWLDIGYHKDLTKANDDYHEIF